MIPLLALHVKASVRRAAPFGRLKRAIGPWWLQKWVQEDASAVEVRRACFNPTASALQQSCTYPQYSFFEKGSSAFSGNSVASSNTRSTYFQTCW